MSAPRVTARNEQGTEPGYTVLQEQSAFPDKNLLPGPRGGSAFRSRSRATQKKLFGVSISPNIIRRTDRARD
jgi:hypothetical protein